MVRRSIYLILIALCLTQCSQPFDGEAFYDDGMIDITEFIEENKADFSRFYQLMEATGLKDPLSAYNPTGNGFTLFLPSDEAFERYVEHNENYSSFEELLEDKDFIQVLCRYHVVNSAISTYDFPYGALPDTTATGDLLTIAFSTSFDSTVYKVNNVAPVIMENLEMSNGFIHVIDEVLQPVYFTGFEWLIQHPDFSILSGAIEATGFSDSLGLYRTGANGNIVPNHYTILAENDSIFERNDIRTVDDLIKVYATPGLDLTDPDNGIYQFVAYHVLEGTYFLADFETSGNYNTFANAPVRISIGLEVRINPGVDTFRLEVNEFGDTSAIDYVSLYYQESNILTKNGAIHFVSERLEYYIPPVSSRTFNFYEAPVIYENRNTPGSYLFDEKEQEELEVIRWTGPEFIQYYKSSSNSELALNDDYIEVEGNFSISYTIPTVLQGRYKVYMRAFAYNTTGEHATVTAYLDGKRLGNSFNLNSGGQSASAPYKVNGNDNGYLLGTVEFSSYNKHRITIESLIPGIFRWDNIKLVPE